MIGSKLDFQSKQRSFRHKEQNSDFEFSTDRDFIKKGDPSAEDLIARLKESKMKTIISVESKSEVHGREFISFGLIFRFYP